MKKTTAALAAALLLPFSANAEEVTPDVTEKVWTHFKTSVMTKLYPGRNMLFDCGRVSLNTDRDQPRYVASGRYVEKYKHGEYSETMWGFMTSTLDGDEVVTDSEDLEIHPKKGRFVCGTLE